MSDFGDFIKGAAPWISAALTGGPVGLATLAATKVAEAVGLEDSSVDNIRNVTGKLNGYSINSADLAAIQKAEQDFKLQMQQMGFQHENDLLAAENNTLAIINATMQKEAENSATEEWYQKAWRPACGFAVALGSFVGVIGTTVLFGLGLWKSDPAFINAIPNFASALALILGVPGAAVGIAAWHRGVAQRLQVESSSTSK